MTVRTVRSKHAKRAKGSGLKLRTRWYSTYDCYCTLNVKRLNISVLQNKNKSCNEALLHYMTSPFGVTENPTCSANKRTVNASGTVDRAERTDAPSRHSVNEVTCYAIRREQLHHNSTLFHTTITYLFMQYILPDQLQF